MDQQIKIKVTRPGQQRKSTMGREMVLYKAIQKMMRYAGTDDGNHFSALYAANVNLGFWTWVSSSSDWALNWAFLLRINFDMKTYR